MIRTVRLALLASSWLVFAAACASRDAEVAKTAADPGVVGPDPAPSASSANLLGPSFDPQSLAPASPVAPPGSSSASGHEHHHHGP